MKPEGLLALAPGCLNPGVTIRKESKLWRSFVASALVSPHLRDTFSVGTIFDSNAQGSGNPGLVTEPRWGSKTDRNNALPRGSGAGRIPALPAPPKLLKRLLHKAAMNRRTLYPPPPQAERLPVPRGAPPHRPSLRHLKRIHWLETPSHVRVVQIL